jgi:hypothetical protein
LVRRGVLRKLKLGLLPPARTYSACKLVFEDSSDNRFMTFDALVRDDLNGSMVHVALPVNRMIPQAPIFAGRPRRGTFKEIREFFTDQAEKHGGIRSECAERLAAKDLAEFLMDSLWAAGMDGKVVEDAWAKVQKIIVHVLGPL